MPSHHVSPSRALRTIRARVEALNPPLELQVRVTDHVAHLEQLAKRLKTLGMNDQSIDRHLTDLFESYETQLLLAVSAPECLN